MAHVWLGHSDVILQHSARMAALTKKEHAPSAGLHTTLRKRAFDVVVRELRCCSWQTSAMQRRSSDLEGNVAPCCMTLGATEEHDRRTSAAIQSGVRAVRVPPEKTRDASPSLGEGNAKCTRRLSGGTCYSPASGTGAGGAAWPLLRRAARRGCASAWHESRAVTCRHFGSRAVTCSHVSLITVNTNNSVLICKFPLF